MFKLTIFIFSLILSISLIGQSLQSINPNSGAPGQYLSLTLSSNNTHFNSGTSTQVWFTDGSNTAFSMSNIIASSPTAITGDVYIPYGTLNGQYNVNAYNNTDGFMNLYNAFTVAPTNAQLISVSPNNGNQGQMLNLSLSCQNASFSSGTNTQVMFSQGSYTMMGTNTTIVNNNLINTDLYIANNAPTGVYYSIASNSIDGALIKPYSFTVNSPGNTEIYPNISKPGKNIDVYIPYLSIANINITNPTYFYKKGNDIIPINRNTNVMEYYGIYATANIPQSVSIGCYDLIVTNNIDTSYIPCALELVAPSQASIDSAIVNINIEILDIYGDNTHFTDNSLSISYGASFLPSQIDSVVVISNEHIQVYGIFANHVVKTVSYLEAWVKVTNNTDDILTSPFKALLFGSINNLKTFNDIKYFPNPTKDIVRIQSEEFQGNQIIVEVYSTTGKLVLTHKFATNEAVIIDLEPYASGIYNIRVSAPNKTKTVSVIRR